MMLRISAAELVPSPWKNGGGETIQIAIAPPGATLEDFDWRVSSARVAAAGPFSSFPGVDRTLALIDGGPLQLRIAGARNTGEATRVVTLHRDTPVCSFAGESQVESLPLGAGPVVDFNVMTRRGRWSHDLQCIALRGEVEIAGTLLVLYCTEGEACCRRVDSAERVTLAAGDALQAATDAPGKLRLRLSPGPGRPARVFVARLRLRRADHD